jgi:hypothetical protein
MERKGFIQCILPRFNLVVQVDSLWRRLRPIAAGRRCHHLSIQVMMRQGKDSQNKTMIDDDDRALFTSPPGHMHLCTKKQGRVDSGSVTWCHV